MGTYYVTSRRPHHIGPAGNYSLATVYRELVPFMQVRHLGAKLGAVIRKTVTCIHRLAPSL